MLKTKKAKKINLKLSITEQKVYARDQMKILLDKTDPYDMKVMYESVATITNTYNTLLQNCNSYSLIHQAIYEALKALVEAPATEVIYRLNKINDYISDYQE